MEPSARCTAIDRSAREVVTASGRRYPYDALVLATGIVLALVVQIINVVVFTYGKGSAVLHMVDEFIEAVQSLSLGQVSRALYEVGGQYRRSM